MADIVAAFRRDERRTAWLLVFVVLVYDFALGAQLVSSYLDRFGS